MRELQISSVDSKLSIQSHEDDSTRGRYESFHDRGAVNSQVFAILEHHVGIGDPATLSAIE